MPVGKGEIEVLARNVDGKTALDGGFPFGDVLNFTSNTKQSVMSAKVSYPLTDMLESSVQVSRSLDEVIGHGAPTQASRQTGDGGAVSYAGLVLEVDDSQGAGKLGVEVALLTVQRRTADAADAFGPIDETVSLPLLEGRVPGLLDEPRNPWEGLVPAHLPPVARPGPAMPHPAEPAAAVGPP